MCLHQQEKTILSPIQAVYVSNTLQTFLGLWLLKHLIIVHSMCSVLSLLQILTNQTFRELNEMLALVQLIIFNLDINYLFHTLMKYFKLK